jgi:hypothetical protein
MREDLRTLAFFCVAPVANAVIHALFRTVPEPRIGRVLQA